MAELGDCESSSDAHLSAAACVQLLQDLLPQPLQPTNAAGLHLSHPIAIAQVDGTVAPPPTPLVSAVAVADPTADFDIEQRQQLRAMYLAGFQAAASAHTHQLTLKANFNAALHGSNTNSAAANNNTNNATNSTDFVRTMQSLTVHSPTAGPMKPPPAALLHDFAEPLDIAALLALIEALPEKA